MIRLDSDDPASAWITPPCEPTTVLSADGAGVATLVENGVIVRHWPHPLAALQWMADHPGPQGSRWVGYLSYDLGRWFEVLPGGPSDDLGLPLFYFARCFPSPATPHLVDGETGIATSTFDRTGYERAVRKAIDYIAAGDVFQINLSQRFRVPTTRSPQAVYARLTARYGALIEIGLPWHGFPARATLEGISHPVNSFAIVSGSPELFLHVDPNRRVITRPIKGTRPRLDGMDRELLASVKDGAELNMIVDLERNDLGRVCQVGSVRVIQPRAIEAHPTVYHGVATVEGVLRPDVHFVDLLRATFPGGSITGAPKVRAMQIIDELEPTARGPYCGAIGYLDADGSMQFSIAIRTIIMTGGNAYLSVGGGIVADSDPAAEYDETLTKAAAGLAALGCATLDDRLPITFRSPPH